MAARWRAGATPATAPSRPPADWLSRLAPSGPSPHASTPALRPCRVSSALLARRDVHRQRRTSVQAIDVEAGDLLVFARDVLHLALAHDIPQLGKPIGRPFLHQVLAAMRPGATVRLHHRGGRRTTLD